MSTDLTSAHVRAIELASIAAALSASLALAEDASTSIYQETATIEVEEAQAAINFIVAALAEARAEALAERDA